MKPAPSQLVAIRKDRKYVRAILAAGPIARKATPWHSDRGALADTTRMHLKTGWKLLYIVTCQLHARKP